MIVVAELALLFLWLRLAFFCALGIFAWTRRPAQGEYVHAPGRVSVVIPALDEEDTIESTLSSLICHQPAPWEIIVVNDGSTDRTREISRKRLEGMERGQVIDLPSNRGKAEALNIGIRATSGSFVATIDADTLVEPGALNAALAALVKRDAGAVAFYLDVGNRATVLGQLQRQEYVATMNFERAGQNAIGAISILPGAATLYRRDVLIANPFSPRTRTEDADLTLYLARQDVRIVLAADAVASTVAPGTVADLLAQRVRWTAGHLQCCALHVLERGGASRRFRFAVFPNFVASTLFAAAGLAALITVWVEGRTSIMGLGWLEVSAISIVLTYSQRGCVSILDSGRRPRLRFFLLEPFASNLVGISSFIGALCSLLSETVSIGLRRY
ncbi:MAG: glycosyltransferase [Candidatus Binatia bacterium]